MKRKSTLWFILAGALLALFLIFTVIVSFVDVQPIGPMESSVGLATVNGAVFRWLGVHPIWETVTDGLGLIAILSAVCFAALGLVQWIRRRSPWRVDGELWALGAFYVLVMAAYAVFEVVVINQRPILVEGALEASYPSSHTMLVLCLTMGGMIELHALLKKKKPLLLTLDILSVIMMATTVVGRLASGVHWLTDIVAGVLLSMALAALYYGAVRLLAERRSVAQCD